MRLLSDRLKAGQIIRLSGQSALSGVVTIGSSPPKEEAPSPSRAPLDHAEDMLEPARRLADAIIMEARQKAARLEEVGRQQLALWRQQQEEELYRLREKAQEEGYQAGWEQGHTEGYMAGVAKAEAEWQQRLNEINAHLQEAVWLKQAMLAEAETEFVHLCIGVVRKVIGNLQKEQEETVWQMIQQALRETQAQGRVRLLVHPADLTNIEKLYREMVRIIPGEQLEILADPSVQRPGCFIYTDQGIIDATLDAQMETILERFLALREKENGHADSSVEIS